VIRSHSALCFAALVRCATKRQLVAIVANVFLFAIALEAQITGPANDPSKFVMNTRIGPMHNTVRYAPNPKLSPKDYQGLTTRAYYGLDINASSGLVDDVQVLRSSGRKVVDDAIVAALRKWTFRPHSIFKAQIPVDFGAQPVGSTHSR